MKQKRKIWWQVFMLLSLTLAFSGCKDDKNEEA